MTEQPTGSGVRNTPGTTSPVYRQSRTAVISVRTAARMKANPATHQRIVSYYLQVTATAWG